MGKLLRIASVLHTVLKLPSVLLTCCEMHRYYVWSTFFCGHIIKNKIGNLLSNTL